MEWNEDSIGRLRALWAEGHSTAEIGRRMGVSKNAVVGKAHRLNLSSRPSPIRRDGVSQQPRPVRRVTGPTLPPLATVVEPAAPVVVAPRLVPVPVAAPRAYGRTHPCSWPLGEPGTRSFRFCDADSVPGKPYCPEHAQIAYVRVRDKREEAA